MIDLPRETTIPAWCRVTGRRPHGAAETSWTIHAPTGSTRPWAVPFRWVDGEPLSETELRTAICLAQSGMRPVGVAS